MALKAKLLDVTVDYWGGIEGDGTHLLLLLSVSVSLLAAPVILAHPTRKNIFAQNVIDELCHCH